MIAIADGDRALTQKYDTLLTRIDSADGRINGMASDISYNRSEVQRIANGVQANALSYEELRSQVTDLDGSTIKNQSFNALVSTAIANDTLIRGINSAITKVNTWYDGNVANVDLVLNSMIENGKVRAGFILKADANGKVVGMEALAGRGDGDFAQIEFIADKFIFNIAGTRHTLNTNNQLFQFTHSHGHQWIGSHYPGVALIVDPHLYNYPHDRGPETVGIPVESPLRRL